MVVETDYCSHLKRKPGRPRSFDAAAVPEKYEYDNNMSPPDRKKHYQKLKSAQRRYNILSDPQEAEA